MKGQVQLLIFRLGDRSYGLHLCQVERVIRAVDAAPLPGAPAIVLGVIDLRGELLPLLNVRGRFGLSDREVGPDDQFIIARTSRGATRRVALAIDGVKEVVERPGEQIMAAEKIVQGLDQIEGVIQLEDGLTLIHDLDRFLSLEEERELDRVMTMEPIHGS